MDKTITVDWDDPKDLRKFISILQIRRKKVLRELGYDQIYFNGSRYNLDSLLPAFEKMWSTNFSFLYENCDETKKYYLYFHCNPMKPLDVKNNIKHLFLASKFPNLRYEPFYVGKGKDKRVLDLNRNENHRKIRQQINKFKMEIDPVIVVERLSEAESLCKESIMIDILGLICYSKHGLLVNLDEGEQFQKRRLTYDDESGTIKKILKSNGLK